MACRSNELLDGRHPHTPAASALLAKHPASKKFNAQCVLIKWHVGDRLQSSVQYVQYSFPAVQLRLCRPCTTSVWAVSTVSWIIIFHHKQSEENKPSPCCHACILVVKWEVDANQSYWAEESWTELWNIKNVDGLHTVLHITAKHLVNLYWTKLVSLYYCLKYEYFLHM